MSAKANPRGVNTQSDDSNFMSFYLTKTGKRKMHVFLIAPTYFTGGNFRYRRMYVEAVL